MNGQQRLSKVALSTPRMARALPGIPMDGTVMVRLLRISGSGLSDFFEPAFRALDLSEHSFHVLCLLVADESGAASPSELSDMVGTSRSNMTRILEELERAGWVARSVAPRDARRHVIAITGPGREKVRQTVPRIAEPIERAFSDLSEEEFALLQHLLRKLVVSLDKGSARLDAVA
ncbi:MarR family winged helix-turn-helix transcriptional regulator [Denitromonas ohlonensis]|uniref:MarR family transcriptional regulator n=2 Tax=Denitromonas TaxID=139331 RepID=A0A557SDA5_9RHOO|nr:MarR family transcriptional regulator [Denitromonas ohlonensis]TVO63523.1 MarR family transcriptional regulator [Denitromonas ohlonensis]TVO75400.1 MarR family transcriptional regulator [Denitromonas ohlonensis]TVT70601.1 MAG: MarR family transcriptional regulator [Denitromonas halophila]